MGAERAKEGEDSVGARRRHEGGKGALEGAGRLGSSLPSRTALAAAERRPDVGEQPRNGGYSNLRTNVRSRTRASQAEPLVGGGSPSALPSAPAAGSAPPRGRWESLGGFIKGPVEFPTEGVTLLFQGWGKGANSALSKAL